MSTYKELIVWQKAYEFCLLVYRTTNTFPKEEMYGLSSQIRRAAVSIPSNISEDSKRGTKKDFCQFLRVAQDS